MRFSGQWEINEHRRKECGWICKKENKRIKKKYAKRENELVYDDIILNLIEKLQKENEELKEALEREGYDVTESEE